MSGSILVTGASGNLGKLVVERLLARAGSARIIAASRKPERLSGLAARGAELRRADFDDEASLASAFQGVERVLLVSTDELAEPGKRLRQHAFAIRAAAAAGVQHVAYTSIVNPVGSRIVISKDHAGSEAELARSGVPYTVLRNNIYSDLLLGGLQRALSTGKLVDAKPTGKSGFVTRQDCANIAAAVLLEPPGGSQVLDVTGPESLSSAGVAALASELSGRDIQHQPVALELLIAGMVEHGLPRALAEVYGSFDAGAEAGELDLTSDHVQRFTGQKPQSLRDFLRENLGAWAG